MKIKSVIAFFAVIVGFALLSAQPFVRRENRNTGLTYNYVNGIAQDRRGYVWIATENGLNRFDGTGFTHFMSGDGKLKSDQLNRITLDTATNVLWVATQRNGLDALDCNTYEIRHYGAGKDESSIASDGVTDVVAAGDGNIWIAHYTAGVDLLNPDSGSVSHYNKGNVAGWPDDHVWTLRLGQGGKILVGHVSHGLTVLDPAKWTAVNYRKGSDPGSLPGDEIRSILTDSKGNVWVATDGGLALFHPETGKFTVFRHNPGNPKSLQSDHVYYLMESSDGKLWISTENGGVSILDLQQIVLREPEAVEFENLNDTPVDGLFISNKSVHITFEDSFGNIWIGTNGDGIDIICHRELPVRLQNTLSFSTPLSANPVMAILADGDRLYVGTDGEGLDIIQPDGSRVNVSSSNSPLKDNAVISLAKDKEGDIWAGTYGGSVVVLGKDGSRRSVEMPDIMDVRALLPLDDGRILAGTGQGLVEIDKTGVHARRLPQPADHRSQWIRTLVQSPDGKIWEGSYGGGIAIYGRNLRFLKRIDVNSGLKSNTINHLIVSHDGNILAATDDGIAYLSPDGKVLKVIDWYKGLADRYIKAINEDKEGNLWLSTGSGVSLIRKDGSIANYSAGYGFLNSDFYGASVAKTTDGEVLFGSHDGIYRLNTEAFSYGLKEVSPIITKLTIFGKGDDKSVIERFAPGSRETLNHDQNSIRIQFGVLDAAVAPMIEWNYRIEGKDARWYPADPVDGILLRDLSPGKYDIQIRASLPDMEEQPVSVISIVVRPPLWATWWAKTIYALLALVLLFYLMRVYKKRVSLEYDLDLERRNSEHAQSLIAERMRFFTNITHELRTPLTLILGPLEEMKSDASLSAKHAGKVKIIHKSAQRLLELINTIMEFRKTETQNKDLAVEYADLSVLLEETGRKYRELNSNQQLEVATVVEAGDYRLWFDPEVVSEIIDNLMSNACKYTVTGKVELRLHHTEESGVPFTEIVVTDTGLGIDPEALPHIFDRYYRDDRMKHRLGTGIGLALVYNLVQLHQGEIFVESQPDKGSVFRFRLHTDNTYPEIKRRLPGETPENVTPAEPLPEQQDEDTGRAKLLIVDDNIDILNYMKEVFGDTYEVFTATDGFDGLSKASAVYPDIIITDIMMPKMGGIEMVRQLKRNPDLSHTPIVVVTAKTADSARVETYECGADSYITKPFSTQVLKARIRNILSLRHDMAVRQILSPKTVETPEEIPPVEVQTETPIVSDMTEADREFLDKLTVIIDENISSEQLDVKFLADRLYMSHSTLYRKVKAVTGMSISTMLRRYRARKAAELIKTGHYTISEIALMVGMGSQGNFRKCFRDEFGVNPSQYC